MNIYKPNSIVGLSFFFTLFFVCLGNSSAIDDFYSIEMIIFQQPDFMISNTTNETKIHSLPVVDTKNAKFNFLTKMNEITSNNKTKLDATINWMLNNNYTILSHTIIENNEFHNRVLKMFSTNQESILSTINSETFSPLDYYSRMYFLKSEHDSIVSSISLTLLNDNTLRLSFNLTFVKLEPFYQENTIHEKRKTRLSELNYFDNPEIGVIIQITKTQSGDILLSNNLEDSIDSFE